MIDKKEKKINKKVELIVNPNLDILFVDNLITHLRSDGQCLLRFATSLPEGLREQVLIMTSNQQAIKMADAICKVLNYYPVKPQEKDKDGGASDKPKEKVQ